MPETAETSETSAPGAGYLARDLFFGERIRTGLQRLGFEPRPLTATDPEAAAGLNIALVDLSTPPDAWGPLVERLHAAGVPVLAFGSHMDQERWKNARAAGATRIVANSTLVERFPDLIQGLVGMAITAPGEPAPQP